LRNGPQIAIVAGSGFLGLQPELFFELGDSFFRTRRSGAFELRRILRFSLSSRFVYTVCHSSRAFSFRSLAIQASAAPPFSSKLITVNSFASAVKGENPFEPRFPIRRRPSSYALARTERATRSWGFSHGTSESSRGSRRGRCARSGGLLHRLSPLPTSDSDFAYGVRVIFASSSPPRSSAQPASSLSISTATPIRPTPSSSSTRW